MRHLVESVLKRWGTELVLQQAGSEIRLRGFLQHSRSKSLQNMQRGFTPVGQVPDGQYVYIGPAQPAAAAGDTLILGGEVYELRRVDRIWFRNMPLYSWGLCVKRGGVAQ